MSADTDKSIGRTRRPRRKALAGARLAARSVIALTLYAAIVALAFPQTVASWRIPAWREIVAWFETIPAPPAAWRSTARSGDQLSVAGLQVDYWGKPDAPYGTRVTKAAKAPVAVVVHFTDETPAMTLVHYGHRGDGARGNSAFGYHFYIDAGGRVFQGAPLSVRTNHIKPGHAAERAGRLPQLDGTNTIGVSLIGACRSPRNAAVTYNCSEDNPTRAQLDSGLAIITALQIRFSMSCSSIYGHGELQSDRKSFEGLTLAERARRQCR